MLPSISIDDDRLTALTFSCICRSFGPLCCSGRVWAPLNIKVASERRFWAPFNVKLALSQQFWERLIHKLALDWWFWAPVNDKLALEWRQVGSGPTEVDFRRFCDTGRQGSWTVLGQKSSFELLDDPKPRPEIYG